MWITAADFFALAYCAVYAWHGKGANIFALARIIIVYGSMVRTVSILNINVSVCVQHFWWGSNKIARVNIAKKTLSFKLNYSTVWEQQLLFVYISICMYICAMFVWAAGYMWMHFFIVNLIGFRLERKNKAFEKA